MAEGGGPAPGDPPSRHSDHELGARLREPGLARFAVVDARGRTSPHLLRGDRRVRARDRPSRWTARRGRSSVTATPTRSWPTASSGRRSRRAESTGSPIRNGSCSTASEPGTTSSRPTHGATSSSRDTTTGAHGTGRDTVSCTCGTGCGRRPAAGATASSRRGGWTSSGRPPGGRTPQLRRALLAQSWRPASPSPGGRLLGGRIDGAVHSHHPVPGSRHRAPGAEPRRHQRVSLRHRGRGDGRHRSLVWCRRNPTAIRAPDHSSASGGSCVPRDPFPETPSRLPLLPRPRFDRGTGCRGRAPIDRGQDGLDAGHRRLHPHVLGRLERQAVARDLALGHGHPPRDGARLRAGIERHRPRPGGARRLAPRALPSRRSQGAADPAEPRLPGEQPEPRARCRR